MCKLAGPQHRSWRKVSFCVGVGRRNKFYENIISVPLPRTTT
ncbi:nitrogen fixation protein NifR [Staphylococcus aureus]|uniref:Nitrogen fixation protein NifR n=1 Tax=Staphylococcus aureus TaxID=1280 RepID=A0A7Z1N5X7_STAAU|nr:nitrogen fixation protein NifR [Staphylococcus aureus]PPJ66783.1 nitrogen fixation protein NifR [Staphylococcus aureus]PPJ75703.1 nitrogen fixation protein NifR [Staphylococcus aureus]